MIRTICRALGDKITFLKKQNSTCIFKVWILDLPVAHIITTWWCLCSGSGLIPEQETSMHHRCSHVFKKKVWIQIYNFRWWLKNVLVFTLHGVLITRNFICIFLQSKSYFKYIGNKEIPPCTWSKRNKKHSVEYF